MFQLLCRFAFLSTFRLSNHTPKIARILTLYQANAATLTPLSKEDKILIKSLQECKCYNARQFITEFMIKGWTKNSINRLLVKFRTVDRRLGSGRRSAHTDENVDTVESLLLSQEDKPQSQEKFHGGGGIHQSSVSQIIHKVLRLKCYKKRGAQQLTEAHSMHVLFSACSLRDNNAITSKPTWKMKHATLFESLLNISTKYHQNLSITFWAIPLQSWAVFLRHSVDVVLTVCSSHCDVISTKKRHTIMRFSPNSSPKTLVFSDVQMLSKL